MSDSRTEGIQTTVESLKVIRGEPFLLFPENKPFFTNSDGLFEQVIQTDNGQKFQVRFDQKKMDEEWHEWILNRRVVLFTKDGPVDVKEGSGTAERLMKGDYYYLHGVWVNSKDSEFKLLFPRSEIVYRDNFFRIDPKLFAGFTPKDSEGEIDSIFWEKNPEFLHKIQAQID